MINSSKSLAELIGSSLEESDNTSRLTSACLALYHKPLKDFTVENLRLMIGQGVGVDFLIPEAISLLHANPFVEGDYYPGDLLSAVLSVPETFWLRHESLYQQVSEIVGGLPSLLADLIEAIRRFDSYTLPNSINQ